MRILITGAHFTPAQAVIEELLKLPQIEFIYVGRKTTREGDPAPSVESEVVPKLGVKFVPIITGRLQRQFTRFTIPSLLKVPIGFIQSLSILLKYHPDVILSFGGYVAVPVVINGWLLSIPIIVHEQTLISGLANTISNLFADKVAVSFDQDYQFSSQKLILTGNPMRKEITRPQNNLNSELKNFITQARRENKPLILILGGNQGSHVINQAIKNILEPITKQAFLIHQTGDSKFNDYDELSAVKNKLKNSSHYIVKKWIDGQDLGELFSKTDLVISRSGMNTLLELAYFAIPTIAIPVPHIYRNEQVVNSKFFEKIGLVCYFPQSNLVNPQTLLNKINEMLDDLPNLKEQAKLAQSVVIPDAAKRLTQQTLILASANG